MKPGMMHYKGYRATIVYDEVDHIFVGEVFGIQDSLNFHGSSIDELETSFHNSIDQYLEECSKLGKEPNKEFSGGFNIRITPAIHELAASYAFEHSISLNQVVSLALEAFLKDQ